MKLLVISNNPDRPSFRQRIGIYLDLLKESNIECDVQKLPRYYLKRWKLFKTAKNYDAVFLHKKALNLFDARILRSNAKKIIYDFDDAIMFSPHKPQSDDKSRMRTFRRTAKLADIVIAGNDYLGKHATGFNDNVMVLPTGLELDEYKIDVAKTDDGKIRLVWIGSKSTLKYLAELKPVFEEVGSKCDNVILRIIADDFIDLENMPVEKYRWSRESQAGDLMECDVGLAPLPDNRFTRGKCGFKILQYFAAALPVVASPVGVNRKFIDESDAGILAEGNKEWSDSLLKMIESKQVNAMMSQKGRGYVCSYNSKVLAKKLTELFNIKAL